MARKKEPPKPLFGLKHDFYESLDHVLQQAINLMQAVDTAVDLEQEKDGPAKNVLVERNNALRAALLSDV